MNGLGSRKQGLGGEGARAREQRPGGQRPGGQRPGGQRPESKGQVGGKQGPGSRESIYSRERLRAGAGRSRYSYSSTRYTARTILATPGMPAWDSSQQILMTHAVGRVV